MIDFTSALYLGMRHASRSLRPWRTLTTGLPAALGAPPRAALVARELALLQGLQAATLGASTLHLFWDLFGMIGAGSASVFIDGGTYPIAEWGAERAAGRGVRVRRFPHHDPDALRRLLRRNEGKGRPLVVADGFCTGCGRGAPIADYLQCIRPYDGRLIVDDTQALGILGADPLRRTPFGTGGGGTLRWSGVTGDDIITISSLAKGFGAPLAVLAGTEEIVERFDALSDTRVHCSPPSIAAIHAAEHAVELNRARGDTLRRRLEGAIVHFRDALAGIGLGTPHGAFPVQTLAGLEDPWTIHHRLLGLGVGTVLHRGHRGEPPRISFLLTARHDPGLIDKAVGLLGLALKRPAPTRGPIQSNIISRSIKQ